MSIGLSKLNIPGKMGKTVKIRPVSLGQLVLV